MRTFKNFLPIFLGVLLLASCEKEALEQPAVKQTTGQPTALQNVSLVEGRLVFNTMQDFQAAIQWLQQHQDGDYKVSLQFPGFKSNREAYEELDQEMLKPEDLEKYEGIITLEEGNGDPEIVPTIDAFILSYIADPMGVLQINDTLMKVERKNAYLKVITGGQKVTADDYNNLFKTGSAQIFPVRRNRKSLDANQVEFRAFGFCETLSTSGKRRVKGELTDVQVILYNELNAQTKHQFKGTFGWRRESTAQVSMNGAVYFWRVPMVGSYVSDFNVVDESKTNVAEIKRILASSPYEDFVPSNANTEHYADNKTCYINEVFCPYPYPHPACL